jgi:hypothetical protein
VWGLVERGGYELPSDVAPQVELVRLVQRKLAAQRASIEDILKEGADAADRASKKRPGKPVAAKGKKR